MSAAATLAGAASPGNRQRPRRSIVQLPSLVAEAARPARGVREGLSCMKGNFHVQF